MPPEVGVLALSGPIGFLLVQLVVFVASLLAPQLEQRRQRLLHRRDAGRIVGCEQHAPSDLAQLRFVAEHAVVRGGSRFIFQAQRID